MNAPLRFAAKACLVTAASGALCIQVAGLFAQDGDTPATGAAAGTKVVQAQATSQDASDQQPESAVQRELRKKYQKEGREMPSMKLEDAPNTQPQSAVPPGGQSGVAGKPGSPAAPGAQPSVAPAKPNWFERTFHIGRGKKQPAPSPQYAAPTAPPTAPYRYPATAPTARPAPSPYYRSPIASAPNSAGPVASGPVSNGQAKPAPIVAGPAAQASPAQPQFREPAPLGPSPTARNIVERTAPPTVRPARPQKDSQPLLDESDMNGDSETLDLDDDEPKVAGQAPQPLSSDAADGPAESPYSGVKIAPNETEQQFVSSRPRTESAAKAADDEADSDDLSLDLDKPARPADKQSPPALAATKPAKPQSGKDEIKDEDDDDDEDDNDTLTLKGTEPGKHADVAAEKIPEKGPEQLVAPAPFSGLKGICPVVLKDNRKLVDAQPDIKSEFNGKTYTFSSIEAKKAFDESPRKYAPAGGGNDVVRLTSGETGVAGTLEHAAWYRGRLYLFSTADSRTEFVETPSKFVIED
jgi:YHS domain-containing protein